MSEHSHRNLRAAATEADPRWRQVLERDLTADGSFVFAVRSTGIYCRPSCPSRRARPENVSFHADPAAAEAAGFRACQRCRPGLASPRQRQVDLIATLCQRIALAERPPTLAELARISGFSPWHLQRTFRAHTGLTPRAYAAALRADRLRAGLASGAAVTGAGLAAGYGSTASLYADAPRALGMAPGRFRAGAPRLELRYGIAPCALGLVLVADSGKGICAIALGDDAQSLVEQLQARFNQARLLADPESLGKKLAQVVDLVERPRGPVELPLDVRGTVFQQRVWQALQAIPAGSRRSYREVAADLGLPQGARAVAAACAANPLALVIPCHRVVRSDGGLAGYRWGLARKAALLESEAAAAGSPGKR